MRQRHIILTIDTISELFKDYIDNEDDLPADAQPVRMLIQPAENGKLAIEFQSDHLKPGSNPLSVSFQLKRMYSV